MNLFTSFRKNNLFLSRAWINQLGEMVLPSLRQSLEKTARARYRHVTDPGLRIASTTS